MLKNLNFYLIIIGMLCALLWGFITAMTFGLPEGWCAAIDQLTFHAMSREVYQMANGFYYDVSNNDMPTVIFLIVFGLIFTLVSFLILRIEKKPAEKYTLSLIVFFSILFRLIILPGELIHENDIYRYIWDGRSVAQGVNPYKYAPADVFMYQNDHEEDFYDSYHDVTIKGKIFSDDDRIRLETLLQLREQNLTFHQRIGHWQVPTIYPPVAQMLFSLPVLIKDNSLVLMKFFFVLFDIGSLFLVIGLLKHFNKDPCTSIIYGWSPLVLFEIANGGHYDSIPIFLTLLSLLLYVKRKHWSGTCLLALATLSKFFSGVLLPILLRPFKIRYVIIFGAVILLFYTPFVLWDQTGFSGVFEGLGTYNAQWSYNSSVFAVIYLILERLAPHLTQTLLPSKVIAGSLYLIFLACLSLKRHKSDLDMLHKCFLAIAGLFIINPVADPWYFCWVIPFLCIFPYRSWYLLSGLLMLSYLNFHSDIGIVDIEFLDISLIGWITYVPFFIYLAIECLRRPRSISDDLSLNKSIVRK